MTIEEMFSWFDILQDKAGSPYFTDAEKQQIFRRANNKFAIDQVFGVINPSMRAGEGSARTYSSVESTIAGSEILSPLILEDLPITSSSTGIITKANIEAAITTETTQTVSYIELLSVAQDLGSGNSLPVRFVRQNDYAKFKNNLFKKASATQPQYRSSRNRFKFDPTGANNYLITLIKEPVAVVFDAVTPANNVDCELPSFTHDAIVAYAIEDAGVATRDQALLMMNEVSKDNIIKGN